MARRAKTAPAAEAASEALETLIQQFSQPLAFLRELVQNALDAGSNRVEVHLIERPQENCALVEVIDTGEGMDREAIDTRLTRLFASSKDGDRTKIGKFGVGFVSVFAIRPLAVVVDTGRRGEAWRIVFNPDRSFDRNRLEAACDGTRVSVYMPCADSRAFSSLVRDCLETVRFWCRHCDVEILFNGQSVNQPLRLEAAWQWEHQHQSTRVVVAPCLDKRPFYGFYNRGLTLLEGLGSPLPSVSFKCLSPYLEHTLTRDNVLQDDNYQKAMGVVRQAAYDHMPLALAQELQRGASPELWSLLRVVAGFPEQSRAFLAVPCVDGLDRPYSLSELSSRPCLRCQQDGPLARGALSLGACVLLTSPGTPLALALEAFGIQLEELEARYQLAQSAPAGGLEELLRACGPLCQLAGLPVPQSASLQANGPDLREKLSLRCHQLGQVEPRPQAKGRVLALNLDHPWLGQLLPLGRHDLGLAAYLLARVLILEQCELTPSQEGQLLSRAIQGRQSAPPTTRLPKGGAWA